MAKQQKRAPVQQDWKAPHKWHCSKDIWRECFPLQFSKMGVDEHSFPANLFIPQEARLLHFGVRSTYVLGLQIGSILSRLPAVAVAKARL